MNKVILTLFLSYAIACTSHAQLTFSFGSDTISTPGGTVDVDINVTGFQDLISMQLSLNWDPAVFSFSSIENVTTDLPDFSINSIGTPDNAVVVDDGELTLSWSGPGTQPASIPDGTRMFTLRLTGVGDLCGSTEVTISNTPRQIEVVDADFNELTVTTSGGALDIYDPTCPGNGGGGGGSNLSFMLDDVSAASGSSICIPLTADNFSEILSFQTGVTWDPSILSFTGITEAGLQSITINDDSANQGELRVLWFFDQAAVSLANGATLFELCFNVVGTTGESTTVALSNLPMFNVEVGDSDGAITDFEISNARFTVGSGGGGGGNMTGVGLIAPDIFTNNASSMCIPVSTKNFTGVAAFQAGISFDPSILTYTALNDISLSAVDVGTTDAAQGELRILWQSDFSTPSVTLADDSELFELCFDVVGSDGARSEIGFINLPNFGVEFSDEVGQSLDFFLQDGSITVGEQMTSGDLVVTPSSATINRGATTCVDMNVSGFTNIQGMGFALEWDPTVLTYIEERNFNLSGLGSSSFSTSGNNRLRVLYTPTSTQSVADGTSIFQVCFQAVDPCGAAESSNISIVSDNTPIEFIDGNNNVLSPILNTGVVTIGNCTAGNLGIEIISVSHPTCNGDSDGVINVDFTNASGTVMCLWTRDSNGLGITANCNLIGEVAGSYTLDVSDQSGATSTVTVELIDPPLLIVEGDVTDASCTEEGQISLSISGGTSSTGAYNIAWSNGLPPNAVVTGLAEGTYTVTVTDDNGCAQAQNFVVEDTSIPFNPVVTDNTGGADNPNGSIDLNPGAGVNLTFNWSTGAMTSSISELVGGTYNVTITDVDNNCTLERGYTVEDSFISGQSIVDAVTGRYNGFGVSCNGETDGILDGMVDGGCDEGPIVIMLNGSEVTLPVEGLAGGDYSIRIEDACGNVYEENFTIEEPDAITSGGLTVVTCPTGSSSNGVVELNLAGGTGTYVISTGNGDPDSGNRLVNVSREVFTVVVTDENSCQVMFDNLQITEAVCPVNVPPSDLCEGRTIISPNSDGVNDAFVISCVNDPDAQPNSLSIFDRWGNLVLKVNDYQNDWTGEDMSGEPLPEGGYMWVLNTGGPGNRDLFRGTVSILR